jgi:hypothetical protein
MGVKFNKAFIWVAVGFLLELGVFTFFRDEHRYYSLPFIWFFGGLITSIGIYLQSKKATIHVSEPTKSSLYEGVLFLPLVLLFTYALSKLVIAHPLDPNNSDVIPTIKIMAQRILRFEYPYAMVDYGWSFVPTYLPMKFLPFTIAELLKIDYRIFAFIIFVITTFMIAIKFGGNKSFTEKIITLALPIVSLMLILKFNDPIFIHSVELLDAAYIAILVYGIFSNNMLIIVFGIVSCLLSRYGIVVWLPIYALLYLLREDKKATIKIILWSVVGVTALYVVPFMWKDPLMFLKSVKTYDKMAIPQWDIVADWYAHIGKPYTLAQGFSFAIHFRDWMDGDTATKIFWMKVCQFTLVVLSLVFCIWWYLRSKSKIDNRLYTLFTLKVFMTLFYGFLYVPYSYLFLLPLTVSIISIAVMSISTQE